MTRSMMLAKGYRRSHSNSTSNDNDKMNSTNMKQDAVLVTGPRIRPEERTSSSNNNHSMALLVEAESYRDVDVSESSVPAFRTASASASTKESLTNSSSPSARRGTTTTTAAANVSNNPIRRLLEASSFLVGRSKPPAEQELEDLAGAILVHSHACVEAPRQRQPSGDYNSYHHEEEDADFGDDDDDDDDVYGEDLQKHYFNDHRSRKSASSSAATNATTSNHSRRSRPCHFLLGETYYSDDDERRREDELSLFWFTYRCDFPSIVPYNITSDAGWGCMLRALQMLTAQSLRLHFKGRQWRPPGPQTTTASTTQSSIQAARQDPFVRSILTWFADFPSTTENIYSLHNMVGAGVAKYNKLPGEWYEPGTACYVLRDLVQMHTQQLQHNHHQPSMFRVHVASGGTVYRDEIDKLVARDALHARSRMQQQQQQQEQNELAHPLDLASWEEQEEEGVVDGTITAGGVATVISKRSLVHPNYHLPWDTALLLLIPLRLGLKVFQPEYCAILAHTFSLPQSVGMLGGRPRGARWFVGASADGRQILGLDPHTVQMAPRRRRRLGGASHQQQQQQPSFVVELSDDYVQSVHATHTEVFALPKLDPSIALGFYCRTRADFEHVVSALQKWKQDHPGTPELFAVADSAPDYEAICGGASTSCSGGDGAQSSGGKQNVFLEDALIDQDDSDDNDDKATNRKGNKHEGNDDDDDDDEFVLL